MINHFTWKKTKLREREFMYIFIYTYIFFETQSHYVGLTGLELCVNQTVLTLNRGLSLLNVEIKSMNHHAQQ